MSNEEKIKSLSRAEKELEEKLKKILSDIEETARKLPSPNRKDILKLMEEANYHSLTISEKISFFRSYIDAQQVLFKIKGMTIARNHI